MSKNVEAIRHVFEAAGIVFIDENGGGRGVRFRERGNESAPSDDGDEASDAE